MLFRAPTTPHTTFERYYQARYKSGLTTELPDNDQLCAYMTAEFEDTEKSFKRYVNILSAFGIERTSRVLDYGCSWGYGSWQFQRHGFDVLGYDLSAPRVAFGREKLGVDLVSDIKLITGQFDVFFSTHVMEHVPDVDRLLDFAFSRLKPGGLFVAVTPNGSRHYRAVKPDNWSRVWGFKHPVVFDEVFLRRRFNGDPYLVTSRLNDLSRISKWASTGASEIDDMSGWELLVAVRRRALRSASG